MQEKMETVHMKKRMMQPILYTLSLIIVILMLGGCSSADPVQEDLINYWNNEIIPLDAEETEILDAYDSVSGDNYTSDEDMLNVLNEITPPYKTLVEKIESIQPETSEVKELHELYIAASNKQYNAFLQLATAIEQQDANLVVEVNEKLDEARKGMRDYQNQLAELQEEYNVIDIEE